MGPNASDSCNTASESGAAPRRVTISEDWTIGAFMWILMRYLETGHNLTQKKYRHKPSSVPNSEPPRGKQRLAGSGEKAKNKWLTPVKF
jgi:hypothetical protein